MYSTNETKITQDKASQNRECDIVERLIAGKRKLDRQGE